MYIFRQVEETTRQKIIMYHCAKDVFQITMNKGVSGCVIM